MNTEESTYIEYRKFTVKLLPIATAGRLEKIIFDREAIYSLDPKTMASYYKDMFEFGGLTTNEIRVKINMRPVSGGDVAFVSANVAPINSEKIYGSLPTDTEGKV